MTIHTNAHLDVRKKGFEHFQSFIQESITAIKVNTSFKESFVAFTKNEEAYNLFSFWITKYVDDRNLLLTKSPSFPSTAFQITFKNREERISTEKVIEEITKNTFFTEDLGIKLYAQCSDEKISNVTIVSIAVPH